MNPSPAPILCSGPAYPKPWSVWADDVCLGRFAHEPNTATLQSLAVKANAEGWNGTLLEVHKHGSWQHDFTPNTEATP